MADRKTADRESIYLQRIGRYYLPALTIVVFFGGWEAASYILDSPLLPRFTGVLVNIVRCDEIFHHLFISFVRILSALLAALSVGILLGIVAARLPRTGKAVSIFSFISYPIPKTVLIPVIVLLLGIGELSKIFLVFLSIVFQIIINVRDAVSEIQEGYYISIYAAGGGRRQIVSRVIFPSIIPALFSTLRISLGIASAVLFFAEYFGTEWGMGFFIMDARIRTSYIDLYSGIVLLSAMMLIIFLIVDFADRKLCHWIYAGDSHK